MHLLILPLGKQLKTPQLFPQIGWKQRNMRFKKMSRSGNWRCINLNREQGQSRGLEANKCRAQSGARVHSIYPEICSRRGGEGLLDPDLRLLPKAGSRWSPPALQKHRPQPSRYPGMGVFQLAAPHVCSFRRPLQFPALLWESGRTTTVQTAEHPS